LSRNKTRCPNKAEKSTGKNEKKSKSCREDRCIFKKDEDWIQGIEVRRVSAHRNLVSTANESVSPECRRRRSRHIGDLLNLNLPLEADKINSKLKPRSEKSKRGLDRVILTPRSGLEKSQIQLNLESPSIGSNTPEKSGNELQQLNGKLDTAQIAAGPINNNSIGTQTTLDYDDSANGENKITTIDLVSQRKVEDLREENESLRRQLKEAADWEMQVMKAYKTLAEKHHLASRSEEASTEIHVIREVPTRQPQSSRVLDHSDCELLHPTTSSLQGNDKTDHHDRASHISDNEIQFGHELPTLPNISSDPLVLRSDDRQQKYGFRDVSTTKTRSTLPKPNLVKSQNSPLEDKMASSTLTPSSRKRATPMKTANDSGYCVVSAMRVNVEEDKLSDVSSIYEQFEISGDRHDLRFPWQHDIYVQCDRMETRDVSIQTDFEPCSECQCRRLSNRFPELDTSSNCGSDMRKRSSAISSSRRSTSKAKPRLPRQNFSLDLNDYSGFFKSSVQMNGTMPPGSPPEPFRSRTSRVSTLRPLSDSDISRSSGENILGQQKIFQRRKNADVSSAKSGITMHLTINTSEGDSLPCSPCPSPIHQEPQNVQHIRSKPKVIVTHHDDPAYDEQSLRSSSFGKP
jgi:hypothetical protein